MFYTADDDDDDFPSSKSSKLATLFGAEQNVLQEGNQSLIYKAPKQGKQSTQQRTATPTSRGDSDTTTGSGNQRQGNISVIHATVVHSYKFEEGKHIDTGKLGVAVVGNHDSRVYKLLLYRGKQHAIASAGITIAFTYTIQKNNYASFYDDQRQTWSIHFDNEISAVECAKQIGLAKANSCSSTQESVIVQDLTVGKGSSVQAGATVSVKYTGYALTNRTFGQSVDESGSFVRVKLGSDDLAKGLEEGIVGMATGSTRLVAIPSTGGHKMANKLPTDAVLIYVVEACTNETVAGAKKTEKPGLSFKSEMQQSCGDDLSVRARGASISEQLQLSPKTDKAKIISRMARMGQPMLPFQGAAPARVPSSESETEEDRRGPASPSPHSSSPEPVPKPRSRAQLHSKAVQEGRLHALEEHSAFTQKHQSLQSAQPMVFPHLPLNYLASQQQIMPLAAAGTNPYMVIPSQPYALGSPSGIEAHIPILLSEVRSQNTELRLQLGQVTEKVDRVLGKLDQSPQPVYPTIEAGMLAHTIQNIIRENESLKAEVKEKNQKVECQTERIADLLQRNQRFLEQSSSMLEQRSTYLESSSLNSQLKVTALEQEKSLLAGELDAAQKKLAEVETQLAAAQELKERLENQLVESQASDSCRRAAEVQALQRSLEQMQEMLNSKEERLQEEESKRTKLQTDIEDFRKQRGESQELEAKVEELNELKNEHEKLRNKLATMKTSAKNMEDPAEHINPCLSSEIKKIMNAVYRNLQKQFVNSKTYTGEETKEILTSTIRTITLMIMEHYESEDKKGNDKEPEGEETKVKEKETAEPEEVTQRETPPPETTALSRDDYSWKPEPPPLPDDNDFNDEKDWFTT